MYEVVEKNLVGKLIAGLESLFVFGCAACQCTAELFIKTAAPEQESTSSLAVFEQKRIFVKKLKSASSIKEMATHLEEMMSWCRRRKLYQERRYLAFTLLWCQRIKALECDGIRYMPNTIF